jgi:hypothetical protein
MLSTPEVLYGKCPNNLYTKNLLFFPNVGVHELFTQLCHVQINYQNGSNIGVYELLGRLPYFLLMCTYAYFALHSKNIHCTKQVRF